jgi:hypothetical protein
MDVMRTGPGVQAFVFPSPTRASVCRRRRGKEYSKHSLQLKKRPGQVSGYG